MEFTLENETRTEPIKDHKNQFLAEFFVTLTTNFTPMEQNEILKSIYNRIIAKREADIMDLTEALNDLKE